MLLERRTPPPVIARERQLPVRYALHAYGDLCDPLMCVLEWIFGDDLSWTLAVIEVQFSEGLRVVIKLSTRRNRLLPILAFYLGS